MVECKGIIIDKKICKVCDKTHNDGIIILEDTICKKCVQSIVSSKSGTKSYNLLIKKIKDILNKKV